MCKIKKGIKIRVTPEQSKKVQEICFMNGIDWVTGKHLKHINEPYLYINKYDKLGYSSRNCDESYFIKYEREEVPAELFIRTNGTCVEPEIPTEDINKEEQMEKLKLKCEIEGYEDTYFEIGQVWETRNGEKIRLKGFTGNAAYPLLFDRGNDRYNEFTLKGNLFEDFEYELDLVKLILPKFPIKSSPSKPPKTLSEYLKENKAYENFVENCVEAFLEDIKVYYKMKSDNEIIGISNGFIWQNTKQDSNYWKNLLYDQPKNIEYDMNEIIFKEVDKRLNKQKFATKFITSEEFDQMLQQKTSTKYMVFVEGRSNPKKIHDSYNSAEKEAKRLSAKEIGLKVFVVEIIKEFKSKVVIEEIK